MRYPILYNVVFVIIITISMLPINTTGNIVNVAAIFDDATEMDKRLAFELAINHINRDETLVDQLMPFEKIIEGENPYEVAAITCDILSTSAVGIFGPKLSDNSNSVESICDVKEIPLVETSWHSRLEHANAVVNIYPHPPMLINVFLDLMEKYKWKSFTILYDNMNSLVRVRELLKQFDKGLFIISIHQLVNDTDSGYKESLKSVRSSEETNFVVECEIQNLNQIFRQAQQLGIVTKKYSYIVTNWDMQTIDLTPYQFSETQIIGIRLIDPLHTDVINLKDDLQKVREQRHIDNEAYDGFHLLTETALMVDAVKLFAKSLDDRDLHYVPPLFCNTTDYWNQGYSIVNDIKMKSMVGLTGLIRFDHQGFRSDFSLDILELQETGLKKIGVWNASTGLDIPEIHTQNYSSTDGGSLQNKTFIVITCLTEPYGMHKQSPAPLTGNDRFEGFGIDLIHELSVMEGFNYIFKIRDDGANGKLEADGKWSGMIGDVINKDADLAITDLTITADREEVVDFTSPFMNLGISILYKKPTKAPPSFFSFADPFASEVWLLLAASFLGVSVALFIMARICPSEWSNPYPCVEEPEYLFNQFSFRNSCWFILGGLMQQGSDLAPIAVSTRMVSGLWWFFTLIMVASYTANLAAFLTTEKPVQPFTTIKELAEKAEQAGITYGAKKDGTTYLFFKNSKREDYQKIFNYMETHPGMYVEGNPIGVSKAENENYAFFMESTSIKYETERHCNLTMIGDLLDEKGYGIAMRKNESYRTTLSTAVLRLHESGKLEELRRKWWEQQRGGGQCADEKASSEAPALNLKNVGGVFGVAVGGTVLACFIVYIELILHTAKKSIQEQIPFTQELKRELLFYYRFKGMVKPVTNRKSPEDSNGSNELQPPEPQVSYGFVPKLTKQPLGD